MSLVDSRTESSWRRVAVGSLVVVSAAGLVVAGPAGAAFADATVSNFTDLQNAFAAGGTATLAADITAPLGQNLAVAPGSPVILNLAGHQLSVTSPAGESAAVGVPSGASFTLRDSSGGGQLTATSGDRAAAVGGRGGAAGGSVTVSGGTLIASAAQQGGAGIGGGTDGAGGPVTVSGGTVTATGGPFGAGIGGGAFQSGGPVTVSGGTVTATGGREASGVGGGGSGGNNTVGAGGTVMVSGGSLTATAGSNGAGVGGGSGGAGGTVTVSNGSLTATGGGNGAGIGGGANGAGGSLTVQTAASATAGVPTGSASAVGAGNSSDGSGPLPAFGSFTNAGSFTLAKNARLFVPAGITIDNSGLIHTVEPGLIDGPGTVHNTGVIDGDASIQAGGDGAADGQLVIDTHNYYLQFDTNGSPQPRVDSFHAYAATIADSGQSLPAGPAVPEGSRDHTVFLGWFTEQSGGVRVGDNSDLHDVLGGDGPKTAVLYAHYGVIPPMVTSVSPSSGPTDGGQSVTILGSNFADSPRVYFGGVQASDVTRVSDSKITATSPAHSAGQLNVYVRTADGLSKANTGDVYTFVADPVVTGLSRTEGPTDGLPRTLFAIYGSGFGHTTTVSFGGTSASFRIFSSRKLLASVPAHSAGTVDVVVSTALGASATSPADQFTYLGTPTVTNVSPAAGPASGATTVVITGTQFGDGSAVRFGLTRVPAADVTVDSDTQITVSSPAHVAGTVNVYVRTVVATSARTVNDRYRYTR